MVYKPGLKPFGTVIVPSGFNVGDKVPGVLGVTTTLFIVTDEVVTLVVVPFGITKWSLSSTLGVVRVPVPVTTNGSGVITKVVTGGTTVKVTTPIVQSVGVATVHTL